jgi:integrase
MARDGVRKRRGRGEGSIEELPSGKFRVVLSLGKDPVTGKRNKLTETLDTKREANAWKAERQAEHARGVLANPGKLTLGEWLDRWLGFKKGKVEPGTWQAYESDVRLHLKPTIGALPLARLQAIHVEAMHEKLTGRGVSATRQAKAATTLRVALAHAVRHNLLPRNPASAVARPKTGRPDIQPFDRAEVNRLLAAARGDRLEALFRLALDAGMRQGELFGLSRDALDLDAGTVRVLRSLEERKGGRRVKDVKTDASRRLIRLHPDTVACLRKHLAAVGGDTVFPDARGGWLRRSNFLRRDFHPLLKRAGLRVRGFHHLRHTMATLLLLEGINVKAVSRRLGHSTTRMTLDAYSHVLPEMEDQVIDAIGRLYHRPAEPVGVETGDDGPTPAELLQRGG